jgi:2-dehydro-3-deoxyphosphogluconate aldolase/(4S)-4-hydroxy-2-oxoglutarate aldolase
VIDVMSELTRQRVVAIVREGDLETAAARVRALAAAGLRVIEISLVTPGALSAIQTLREDDSVDALIGVGTALTAQDVKAAAAAGAQFVVSPVVSRDVLRACTKRGLPAFPGAATPTEAHRAMERGATAVKIFPASLWTPAVLHDVLAAMPDLPAVPTGGITLGNAPEWIAAGALAVGVGGTLTRSLDPATTARSLLDSVAQARP